MSEQVIMLSQKFTPQEQLINQMMEKNTELSNLVLSLVSNSSQSSPQARRNTINSANTVLSHMNTESSNITESTLNPTVRSFSLPSKYCKISGGNRSVEKLELDVLFKDWHVDKIYRCQGNNTNEKRFLKEAKGLNG